MRKKIKFLLAIIMMLVGATTAYAATVHTSGRVRISDVSVGDIIKQDCEIYKSNTYSLEIYDTDGTTLLQQYGSSGFITNVQPGYHTVVVSAGNLVKLLKIADGAAVTSVTLNQSSLPLIVGGETATLIATVNANDDALNLVSWSSSETSVATVNNNGVVTPVAEGTATITVTSLWDNTKTATCVVTVADTHTVTLKEGTEDAANWTGKVGDATTYKAFPLKGVTGQTVTVKYDGTRKVKSVTARLVAPEPEPVDVDTLTLTGQYWANHAGPNFEDLSGNYSFTIVYGPNDTWSDMVDKYDWIYTTDFPWAPDGKIIHFSYNTGNGIIQAELKHTGCSSDTYQLVPISTKVSDLAPNGYFFENWMGNK